MMAQHTACLLLLLTFLGVLGASAISACPPPQDVAALEQGSTAADVEGFQGFDVTVLKAGETHRTLCPGALHLLNFTFTAEAQPASASGLLVQRDVTVFASKGQWLTGQEGGDQGSPSNQCPGLLGLPISTFPGVPSFRTHTLGLPCTASGKVVLLIAPVNQSSSNSSQGTPVAPAAFVFAIDPTCAASTCSSQERPVASAVDLDEGSSTGLSSPQALQDPSQDDHLGYKYTRKLGAAILHWTVGTEQAPDNECTAYQESTAAAARHAGYDGTLVHFALEANVSGYVAMGFTGRNSRMFPADIIMGWDDDNKGPSIDTYYVEGHHLSSDMRTPHSADTWVTHKGVVQRSWINGVPRTIICFTRRLKEPKARVAQDITPPAASAHGSSGTSLVSSAAKRLRQLLVVREMPEPAGPGRVAITWAVSAHDRIVLHTFGSYGSATLDLRTGAMTTNQPWDRRENIRGHGIRNIVAWAFLLPFGSLVPAHRWVFGNRMWGPKPVWFWLHMAFQLSGYLIFIGGFFFMVAVTPSPRTNIATAHKNLGLAIVAAASAQVLFGFIRPTPDATYRWIWNLFHHNLGRVCVIASWVTILTGVVNYHSTVYDTSYAPWLISACILMAAVILTEVTLRICKPKDNTLPTRVPPIKDDMLQTSPSKLVTVPVTEGQQQQHGAASGSGLSSCDEATDNACTAVPGGDSEDTSSSEKDTYIQMDCSRPLSSTGKRVSDSEASGVSQASNPYPRRQTGGITAYTAGDEESALPCAAHGGRCAMSVAGGVGASDVSKPSAGGLRLR